MKNKKMFMWILYVVLMYLLLSSAFLIYYGNPKYKEKEKVIINDLYLNVINSYITNYNDYNELISIDNSFLIVNIDTNINKDNLILKIEDKYYYNNNEYSSLFQDIASNYIVYIVNKDDLNKKMELYYRSYEFMFDRNYRIRLNPINLDLKKEFKEYYLNDTFTINNTESKILDYSINDTFIDNLNNINYITNYKGQSLLKLHFSNVIPNIDKYIKLNYIVNDKEKEIELTLVNNKIINNNLYFIVDNDINNASNISIIFTNRYNNFIYILK